MQKLNYSEGVEEKKESLDHSLNSSTYTHQMAPESGNGGQQGAHRMGKVSVSSTSSTDSIDPDQQAYFSRGHAENDLDRLSMCLSEASSEANDEKTTYLITDVLQAQLAWWTLIFSLFYGYAWQYHRKKFLFSLHLQCFMVPAIVLVCCTISCLLSITVCLAKLFSYDIRPEDFFNLGRYYEDQVETNLGGSKHGGSGNLSQVRRRRTTSGNSCLSTNSNRSLSYEELPKPVCRKHSTQHYGGSSLSLVCGTPTSPMGNGFANGFTASTNGFGHSYGNGLNRSLSMSGTAPKLSYQFSHTAGGG